jgi:hypothetical protein
VPGERMLKIIFGIENIIFYKKYFGKSYEKLCNENLHIKKSNKKYEKK